MQNKKLNPKKLLCCLITFSLASLSFAEDEPKSHFFTTSDDIRIHYLTLGDKGSPVMLIHGYLSSAHRNWFNTGIAQLLAENHRVIALDSRNHGKSQIVSKNAFGSVLEVRELIDYLDLGKMHIHGYSNGGDRVRELLLEDQNRFITAIIAGSGIYEVQQERIDALLEDKKHPEGMFSSFISRGPDTDLSLITVPVMAINGEYDKPIAKTTRLTRELSNFTNVVLVGRGHMDALRDPKYKQELSDFIEANDP